MRYSRPIDYLYTFNPRAAIYVAAALLDAGNSLEYLPERGRVVLGTNYRELVTAYTYVIRYRIANDEIVITRVRHTARQPTKP